MKKNTTIELIKAELLSKHFDFPILTTCKISRCFINKELVEFIARLLNEAQDKSDRELMLLRLKKIILQMPREPDPSHLEAEPFEFAKLELEIAREQAFFEPIKWIDAELDFLRNIKTLEVKDTKSAELAIEHKELLNQQELLSIFNFSKSTLNRRIAEGLPTIKLGAKLMFNRHKVNDWLNQLE